MKLAKFTVCAMIFVCAAAKGQAQQRITPEEYIEKYKHLAMLDQEIYGIPASIKMAQAILESDSGNSRLALLANNHFGIKSRRDWTGPIILHDDDEPQEGFRKYASAECSFRDHSEFLDKSARYQLLFDLPPTDYRAWAHGLRAAGYATNPRYGDLLIGLIERHGLYRLDTETLSPELADATERRIAAAREASLAMGSVIEVIETQQQATVASIVSEVGSEVFARVDVDDFAVSTNRLGDRPLFFNNGSEFVVAQRGDTYEAIAQQARRSASRLRRFNDAAPGSQPAEGEQVYIHAKSNRSKGGKLLHVVACENETLRDIAQFHGIKLRSLARLNRMNPDAALRRGQQIRLS